ncbi:MAG: hypothetical protein E6R04_00920 [Spirochaetes bacterium]|nr:MAG: hypothetical protein E6R04_00920 [Spirochaetota bacterium]
MPNKRKKLPDMYWNHRVIQYPNGHFGIHEAHYEKSSTPNLITLDAVSIYGESLEEVKQTLERMLRALEKSPLKYRKYVKKKDDNKKWK